MLNKQYIYKSLIVCPNENAQGKKEATDLIFSNNQLCHMQDSNQAKTRLNVNKLHSKLKLRSLVWESFKNKNYNIEMNPPSDTHF